MRLLCLLLIISYGLSAQSPIPIRAEGAININFPSEFNADFVEDMHYDYKRKKLYIYGKLGRGGIEDGLRIDPQMAAIAFDLGKMPAPDAKAHILIPSVAHFFVDEGEAECGANTIQKIYPLGDYIGTAGGGISIHSKNGWNEAHNSPFYCMDYWGGSRTYGYFQLPSKRFAVMNYDPKKKSLHFYGIRADGTTFGGEKYDNQAFTYYHPCAKPDASGNHYLLSSWTDGFENVELRLMKLGFSGTDDIEVAIQDNEVIDIPILQAQKISDRNDPDYGATFDVRSAMYDGLLDFYFREKQRPRSIYENSLLRWNDKGNLVWSFHSVPYPASWGHFYTFELSKKGELLNSMERLYMPKIRVTQTPLTVGTDFDKVLNVYTWKNDKDYSHHYYVDAVDVNDLKKTQRLHFELSKEEYKRIARARNPDKPDYFQSIDDDRCSAFLVTPNKGYLCIVFTADYGVRGGTPLAQLVLVPFSLKI